MTKAHKIKKKKKTKIKMKTDNMKVKESWKCY